MSPATDPDGSGGAAGRPYVLHGADAERRWLGDTVTAFLAEGGDTGGGFALVDELAHAGESVPLHLHRDDVESFYVVDGEVTFFLDGNPGVRARAGAFVHVPAGVVHGFRVESEAARYLILTTARHGAFYRAITLPSGPLGERPRASVDGSVIRDACRAYGIEPVGPLPGDG